MGFFDDISKSIAHVNHDVGKFVVKNGPTIVERTGKVALNTLKHAGPIVKTVQDIKKGNFDAVGKDIEDDTQILEDDVLLATGQETEEQIKKREAEAAGKAKTETQAKLDAIKIQQEEAKIGQVAAPKPAPVKKKEKITDLLKRMKKEFNELLAFGEKDQDSLDFAEDTIREDLIDEIEDEGQKERARKVLKLLVKEQEKKIRSVRSGKT